MILRRFMIRLMKSLKIRWALVMKSFVLLESLVINRLWNIRLKKRKEGKKKKFIRQTEY